MAIDFYTGAFADNLRLAKSKAIISPSDDTYNVIRIPKNAFVTDVWLEVIDVPDVKPLTCEVGWTGNKETAVSSGFITTDVADAGVAGLKRAQKDTLVTFEGKYFNNGTGGITFTYSSGVGATELGTFRVFVSYIVVH